MAADWLDTLTSIVEAQWNDEGYAVLLSRVPSLLEQEGLDPQTILQGRKLRPLLLSEAAERLKLLQSETNHIIWGIVPADAPVSAPFVRYFRPSAADRPLRFAPSAWKAFTVPIAEDQRRWLFDEPAIYFEDRQSEEAGDGGHEVERRFIVRPQEDTEESEVFRARVVATIGAWAAEQDVDPSRFALGRRRAPATKPSPTPPPHPVPSLSATALDQLISLLQPGELTRITMPLDVVARLRSVKLKPDA
ncbi:hypothetical protein D3C72_404630 [compost metagenome]